MSATAELKFDPAKTWEAKSLKHDRQMMSCRFSPCGKFVCGGTIDNAVLRWEVETGKKTVLQGHDSWVGALAFHPGGKLLFTTDFWGKVICWDYTAEEPKPVWTISHAHDGLIRQVAASPDGKMLVTSGHDGAVRAWSSAAGKLVHEFAGHEDDVFNVEFHPDGKSLVSGDIFGKVIHWDLATRKQVRTLDASALWTDPYKDGFIDVGGVRAMAFNHDGTLLACAGMSECNSATFSRGKLLILEFDWATGKKVRQLYPAGDGHIKSVAYLKDGTLIGGAEGPINKAHGGIWFWKQGSTEPFHKNEKMTHSREIDIHPDGRRFALAHITRFGRGGNGRRKGEYASHKGSIGIYQMTEKPPPPPKKKK